LIHQWVNFISKSKGKDKTLSKEYKTIIKRFKILEMKCRKLNKRFITIIIVLLHFLSILKRMRKTYLKFSWRRTYR